MKWLRVVEAAAPYGLAPLSGSITDVGIVGYTTGGGLGPMARTYGLAIDKVRAIEVVTGDGVLRRATPTEHPELFFGLRGGKGMLGIVTAIEFDLVHQPTFYGGSLWFDGDDAATVIERWRALVRRTCPSWAPPRSRCSSCRRCRACRRSSPTGSRCRCATSGPATPRRGSAGSPRSARRRRSCSTTWRYKPYTAIDSVHTDPLDPTPAYEAAAVLTDFPDRGRRRAARADRARARASPQVLVEVRQMGGAIARGGEHDERLLPRATRRTRCSSSASPASPGWRPTREAILEAMDPWTGGHRLPNFTFTPEEYVDAYDEVTLARLRRGDPHLRPGRRHGHRPHDHGLIPACPARRRCRRRVKAVDVAGTLISQLGTDAMWAKARSTSGDAGCTRCNSDRW